MSKIPRKFIPANMNGSKQELSEISVDGIRLINYIVEKRTCKLLVHVLAKIYQKKKTYQVFGKENNFNQNIRLKLACKPVRVLRLAMHTRLIFL